WC
ncbi:hypothetical protein ECEC1856_0237, partial [Escherichia coli EC1856]